MCPGALANELGLPLRTLRPHLVRLQRESRLRVTQRGEERALPEVRGPFRVAPVAPAAAAVWHFAACVGIDYSGAGAPDSVQPGIRVFCASGGNGPMECAHRPDAGWSRKALHAWLNRALHGGTPLLIGIDHALGVPADYARRHRLKDWDAVLRHMVRNWPADRMTVQEARQRKSAPPAAEGYRTCDHWTVSAKSIFHFDVPGSVASSTFAGIPWIARLRRECGAQLHFWPFDGWVPPPGKSVVAEVYPSLWRRRFAGAPDGLGPDQRDAWTVATWLQQAAGRGLLERYWTPPLEDAERRRAAVEGWILGVC